MLRFHSRRAYGLQCPGCCGGSDCDGLSDEEIVGGISSVEPVGGRSHVIHEDKVTIIDDCYNANPVSMKAAIDLLSMANTRKVAILGDMFELGNNEKALHEEIGTYAAYHKIDCVICVGNLCRHMYDGVKAVEPTAGLTILKTGTSCWSI